MDSGSTAWTVFMITGERNLAFRVDADPLNGVTLVAVDFRLHHKHFLILGVLDMLLVHVDKR